MVVTNPILPPKKGYVEDVSPNGEHYYKKVETEADDLAAMTVDHEYRLTLLELGVTEGGEA